LRDHAERAAHHVPQLESRHSVHGRIAPREDGPRLRSGLHVQGPSRDPTPHRRPRGLPVGCRPNPQSKMSKIEPRFFR
jgi:hypothetical protein